MKRAVPCLLILCMLLGGCKIHRRETPYFETRFLLDTVCTVRAGGENPKEAVLAAFSVIEEVQNAVNFYDENSVVSAFNRAAAHVPVPLDAHAAAIAETALTVSAASDGAFDITVAPVSRLWPFHGEEDPTVPSETEISEAEKKVGYQKLIFSKENGTLAKTEDGVMIDLGGAAKGYAADAAADAMRQSGAAWGLLDLGGNVYAFGKNPNRRDGSWQVGIQVPYAAAGTYEESVTVTDCGAVVSSGTYQRGFTYDGVYYHHVLDPKSGYPAKTETEGVSIAAKSALIADCLSTACLILGRESGTALANRFGAESYFSRE